MFEVNNGVAKIDGLKGKYDNKVSDSSVKYGRNAVSNYYSYIEAPIVNDNMATPPILDMGLDANATENNIKNLNSYVKKNDKYLDSLPPLEFEYRYMPQIQKGEIDKNAVLGAAYEELGKNKELEVSKLDAMYAPSEEFSSNALDINNDGKVDIAEYGSSIIAADILSKGDGANMSGVTGTINKKGFNAILEYNKKSNIEAAKNLYTYVYNASHLDEAKENFKPEK